MYVPGASFTNPSPSVANGSIATAWPSSRTVSSWLSIFGTEIPACRLYCSRLCPVRLAIGFNLYSFMASSTAAPISPTVTPALTVLMAASSPAADASIISCLKFISSCVIR